MTTVVMKNCEPFVFLPALAMESKKGLSCLSLKFSSEGVLASTYNTRTRQSDKRTSELFAVDGLSARAVAASEVTTLKHEIGNHAVERRACVAEAVFASAELAEILRGLWHDIVVEFEDDTA